MRNCKICGEPIVLSKDEKEEIENEYYEYSEICTDCFKEEDYPEDFEYMQYSDADPGL